MDCVFTEKAFYGATSERWQKTLLKLLQKERELKHEYLSPDYVPSFDSPDPYRNVFHKQSEALDLVRSRSGDLHVFAFESDGFAKGTGQRLFLVASYEHFWFHYSRLPDVLRHHYEVIPQDAVCRLYADLEFDIAMNPDRDGDTLVATFIKLVCYWLKSAFGIECSTCDVLNLNASTAVKFSCHLVFHTSNAAFRNNHDAGNFMKFIYSRLLLELNGKSGTDGAGEGDVVPCSGIPRDELDRLLVSGRSGSNQFFCDLGVYTKNRNFRLFLSSKLGKVNPLVLAKDDQFHINDVHLAPNKLRKVNADESLFLSSLVCHVDFTDEVRLLDFEAQEGPEARVLEGYLCPASDTGYRLSPYPQVDEFVRSVITRGRVEGEIWRWAVFTNAGMVVYDIVKNRWCENIGRAHRRNNVIIVVDLRKGVYYQKCHDPDCKAINFRSPERSLPQDLLAELKQKTLDVESLDRVDSSDYEIGDDDLIRADISFEEISKRYPDEIDFDDDDDDLLKAEVDFEFLDAEDEA